MGDTANIPFADQQATGLDALAGAPPLMANSLTDIAGVRKARPGISAWSDFPTAIPSASAVEGMAALGARLVYVTADRRLWACNVAGSTRALSDATVASRLEGTLRPQLLSLRSQVVAVGGGAPQATAGTALSAVLGGSPPDSHAIADLATRIILAPNNTSGTFRWSGLGDVTGHTAWDALDFAEAEAKHDPVQNIATNSNELFVFGTQTIQVFSPDPVVAFSPGRTMNIGLLAPYSLVEVDDAFAFLDRNRRFVLTDGRSFSDEQSVLSAPIEETLRGLTTVSDCWGFRMRTGRWDAVVWFFPTEGRGYIWNRRSRGWSEWRAWGSTGWTTPTITSALHWPEQNVFLVGLSTGQIAKLDADAFTDLGQPIKVEIVSGFDDNGTDKRKKCNAATFVFRRGQTAQSGTAPQIRISYRDNEGPWGEPTIRDLGLAGDYDPTIELRSLGTYRRRQWKVEFDANAGFTFIGARTDTTTLRM